MIDEKLNGALSYVLGRYPDGAAFHFYTDVTITVQQIDNGVYTTIVFNRYGNIIDCLTGESYQNTLRTILGKWGYPLNGWRALVGFSLRINERPADYSPPHGIMWKAMHPADECSVVPSSLWRGLRKAN